jgi:glycerophosphoryl diester phosphodiesterase
VKENYPFFAGPKPRIFGHRGAKGEAPENTLTSFQRAFEDGAAFIELDVRGTKDGEIVIIHDATLDRTTNGRGQVKRWKLKELKELDAGYRYTNDHGANYPYRGRKIGIPTLEELFVAFPGAKTIVEIKQTHPPIVPKVIETICRKGKNDQVLLATENDSIMREIRRELRENSLAIATGFSQGEVAAFLHSLARGKSGPFVPSGQAFQLPCEYGGITLVSSETLNAAHDLGLEVFVWTINEIKEMDRLLRLGTDGIITDHPARLRDLLSQKGS